MLFGHLSWLALHYGRSTLGSLITAAAFGVTAATSLIRMLAALANLDRPSGLFDLSTVQLFYLMSFSLSLLIGAVGLILLVNERLRNILEFNAAHDPLTGILNRGAFFDLAQPVFARHRHEQRPLSIASLDLDHFKQINDAHGHGVGDRVLCDFCRSIEAKLGLTDVFGRYGGEEFVLLLPDRDEAQTRHLAQQMMNSKSLAKDLPAYTYSIGLASLSASTSGLDALLQEADAALYRAKGHGRNRVEFCSSV